jgi:hypothetical protein
LRALLDKAWLTVVGAAFAWKPKALPQDNSFWVYGATITVSGGRYSTTMTLQKLQEQTIHNKLARALISLQ